MREYEFPTFSIFTSRKQSFQQPKFCPMIHTDRTRTELAGALVQLRQWRRGQKRVFKAVAAQSPDLPNIIYQEQSKIAFGGQQVNGVFKITESEMVECHLCQQDGKRKTLTRDQAFFAGPMHSPQHLATKHICTKHLDADAIIHDVGFFTK
ncbi:MAG: hypothetical protein ACTS9Y_00335 [Methylophilus sp.]|uniref:hypothetical protein n=1 Tax=Methylophilus sp. TaxID=29541 RepID=UPI003F9F5507